MFLTYFKTLLLYTNSTKALEILATPLGFQNPMFEGFQRNLRISLKSKQSCKPTMGLKWIWNPNPPNTFHSIHANQTDR